MTPIRALFDTNVLISYLLPSREESAVQAIMEAAFEGGFTLLLVQEIVEEFSRKVARKKYLASRISREEAEELVRNPPRDSRTHTPYLFGR